MSKKALEVLLAKMPAIESTDPHELLLDLRERLLISKEFIENPMLVALFGTLYANIARVLFFYVATDDAPVESHKLQLALEMGKTTSTLSAINVVAGGEIVGTYENYISSKAHQCMGRIWTKLRQADPNIKPFGEK